MKNTKIMLCEVIGSINIVNYFPLRNWLTISVDFCENIISKTAGHVNNSVVYAWHEDDMRVWKTVSFIVRLNKKRYKGVQALNYDLFYEGKVQIRKTNFQLNSTKESTEQLCLLFVKAV